MRTLLVFFMLSTLVPAALAAAPKQVASVEGITEYDLDNGLRVLLFPAPGKPTITVNVTYLVGSRHEGYGETGMAHLLEHMMFKGTPKHSRYLAELESRGARSNGSTDTDRTNYFETFAASPANLKWALELEADRMVHAKIAPEDLKSEFSVVRNEFEIGETQPTQILVERMQSTAYLWHNYGKSPIGSRSDIERVPVDSLRAFYTRFYQPDNAVLVVAGKFDAKEALKEIAATFGKLPRPKRKLPPTYTIEPVQDGDRSVTLRRTGDTQAVGLMYHGVSGADVDAPAEQALVDLLTATPSGRLYHALIDAHLASTIEGTGTTWLDPGVFYMVADVRAGQAIGAVRDKMIEVVEGVVKTKITDEEVARWKAKALREIELELTDPEQLGVELSEWMASDWRTKFIFRDRVQALTAAQVQAFAAKFLKPSNRTVGLFIPEKAPERAAEATTPDVSAIAAKYVGHGEIAAGETFDATIANIDKRTLRSQLANGMQLALLPKRTRGGAVQIVLTVRAGSEATLRGKATLASLMTEAIMRGTTKHSFQQIHDLLDQLKAEVKQDEGLGGNESSGVIRISTVRASVPALLKLLAEIVRHPTFPKEPIVALKEEQIASTEKMAQQPIGVGFMALMQKASPWPVGDPRHVASPSEQIAELKQVTPEALADFHKRLWGGEGASLVMVGDFDETEVKAIAQQELGDWKAQQPWTRVPQPYLASTVADDTLVLDDKAMAIVGLALALPLGQDDPDYPALALGNFVYGGGEKSRIWDRLREHEGLSYTTFAMVNASMLDASGLFLAAAFCAPQNAVKAMTGLVEELGKLGAQPISDKELKDAKKAFQAHFDNELSADEMIATMLNMLVEPKRTMAYFEAQNAKVQAVTAAQVQAAWTKYVKRDALVKVRAGALKN